MALSPLVYSVGLLTLAFGPMWVQHLIASDGGVLAMGGGKITELEIFGDGKKVKGYPPLMFHVTAIAGVAHIFLTAIVMGVLILCSSKEQKKVRDITTFTGTAYVGWLLAVLAVQFTHPWTEDPVNLMEMPGPLLLAGIALNCAALVMEFMDDG